MDTTLRPLWRFFLPFVMRSASSLILRTYILAVFLLVLGHDTNDLSRCVSLRTIDYDLTTLHLYSYL